MIDKAAQLKGILTAFYADHQSNIHDGRSASRPDIDGYVRRIELLFAPETNASITTLEGQAEYYADLAGYVMDENERLLRALAEYEAYEERDEREKVQS